MSFQRERKAAEKEYCNAGDTLKYLGEGEGNTFYTCQNNKGETLNKCGYNQVIGVYKEGYGCTYLGYWRRFI